jgi:hypothetical protein
MFKQAVQRGRSERETEALHFTRPSPQPVGTGFLSRGRYVEGLSDARTKPRKGASSGKGVRLGADSGGGCNEVFFNILRGLNGLLCSVIGTTDEWP